MNLANKQKYLIFYLFISVVLAISAYQSPLDIEAEAGTLSLLPIYMSAAKVPTSTGSIHQITSSNSTFNIQPHYLDNASILPNPFVIERNWTGSIATFPAIMDAFRSQIRTSMNEATTAALDEVGRNSTAISSTLRPESGFIVYIVVIVDNNDKIHQVIVDAGNGNVLADILLPTTDVTRMRSGPIFGQPAGPLGPNARGGYPMPPLPPPIPNTGGSYAMPPLPPPIPNTGGSYAMPPLPPPIPNTGGSYAMPHLSANASPIPDSTAQPTQPQFPLR
jgi:hypothetical protein